ncbi:hypothetical protein H2198_008896 [Neophaeococcomyces mojaviensis]|uniref:Uncharacterized protein n=1 Tax=Neophaeococcomyces mojaviensis TaxID=3383035 RepID=A0ACC2ZW62_9EURO|nr:hypothetical protein H2198_008896 [Knufia sp. JES_112]
MSAAPNNTHLRGSQQSYSRSATHRAGLSGLDSAHNCLELASEDLPLTMLNIPPSEPLKPDNCPIDISAQHSTPGKHIPNKLQKRERGRTPYPTTPISPSQEHHHPKIPTMSNPITDSLKAKIRNGPVGKSLGKLAVEHDLVSIPQPPADAVLGIPEDEKHSRNSYICIMNDALDYARTHLEKGERPVFVDPVAVRNTSAPGRLCVPVTQLDESAHMHLLDSFEGEKIKTKPNKSAPPHLESWKVREQQQQQQHSRQADPETNAGRSSSPARHPSELRPGKKHSLCDKFELSTASGSTSAGKSVDPYELHLPKQLPHTYHGSSSRDVATPAATRTCHTFNGASGPRNYPNYSKPLPVIPELRPGNPRPRPCYELEATQSELPCHYPKSLGVDDARQHACYSSLGSTGKSHPTISLTRKPDFHDLTSQSLVSVASANTSNIKMFPGRRPSDLGSEPASPRTEAKRRSKQHRGTVIVTCDSDKDDATPSFFTREALEQLKHIGEIELVAESETLTMPNATAVSQKMPRDCDLWASGCDEETVKRKALPTSASRMWFASGHTMVPGADHAQAQSQPQPSNSPIKQTAPSQPSQTFTQLPGGHPHPLRSNATQHTHPDPNHELHHILPQFQPGPPHNKPISTSNTTSFSDQELGKPNRSLKSVRRTTRDPANGGTAFGVQQFPDHDPAATYSGNDEYRKRRRAERKSDRDTRRKFEEAVMERYREQAKECHSSEYVEELKERGKW